MMAQSADLKPDVLLRGGHLQEYGVNYTETFAPVTQLTSVRIVLCLALQQQLHCCKHVDATNAFLHTVLEDDEIWIKLPKGYEFEGKTYAKLNKSLYGLKQSNRGWFQLADAAIMAADPRMQRSTIEPCLYYFHKGQRPDCVYLYTCG